ncbi:MAG: hypothetical protein IJ793_01650 [Opitutales bacterium]|nr:hypothetical protein [Opitutales bacterium]
MAYSVSDLNTSPVTYPRVHNGGTFSAVGSKNPLVASVGSVTATEDVKAHYTEIFNHHANVQENLLKQLNGIFNDNESEYIPMDGNRHVNFTDFIKDVCVDSDQANDAYKFYGRQIIEQINQLGDYILKARALLNQATADMPQWIIDQLDILDGFSKEMNETFGFRYIYDKNEDIWKLYEDDYTNAIHTQVSKKDTYEELRTMEVQAYEKQEYQKEPVFGKKTIEVFNELNLLDRLKYIKLYYDIDSGKTDALFPNDKVSGIPTVKEASKTDVIAAIEPFFMGYLIDRDGPVNAVSSFLEVKSAALIEKINIESQKIKALNVYLKFIQRALDILNASQSGADGDKTKHRLPDGAMVALTLLCGGNIYNLFETKDGKECLVIEDHIKPGNYLLVPTDEDGMRYLFGDTGDTIARGDYRGNGTVIVTKDKTRENGTYDFLIAYKSEVGYDIKTIPFREDPTYRYSASSETTKEFWNIDGYSRIIEWFDPYWTSLGNEFTLPEQIDCEKINPKSVRRYWKFWTQSEITTDTVSSWQKAFQDKISFIETAIETVNTDIKVFRGKIDTLDALSSTFRNRTHTAYMKVASNLKK